MWCDAHDEVVCVVHHEWKNGTILFSSYLLEMLDNLNENFREYS